MNNNKTPLVSVIIPTFNRAKLVPRAIKSILDQSYANFECIVVDDASTDDTKNVVNSIKDERIIYLRHQENRHVSATRNTGINNARGEFIAFLDDDDEWTPDKLEVQVPVIEKTGPEVGLVYAWMEYFQDGKSLRIHAPELRGNVFVEMLDKQAIGGCPTLMIKRKVLSVVKGFDENLPRGNDGDFIRRISKNFEVDFVPKVLARVYVGHNDRISLWNSPSRNRVFEYIKRLEFYASDFDQHPDKKLNILSNMSMDYILMGNVGEGLHCFWKAMCCRCRSWYKISAFFAFTKRLVGTFCFRR